VRCVTGVYLFLLVPICTHTAGYTCYKSRAFSRGQNRCLHVAGDCKTRPVSMHCSAVIDVQMIAKFARGIFACVAHSSFACAVVCLCNQLPFCFTRVDRAGVLHSQNERLGPSLKWPSHVKLMLAYSCWQIQIGVCVNDIRTCFSNCW